MKRIWVSLRVSEYEYARRITLFYFWYIMTSSRHILKFNRICRTTVLLDGYEIFSSTCTRYGHWIRRYVILRHKQMENLCSIWRIRHDHKCPQTVLLQFSLWINYASGTESSCIALGGQYCTDISPSCTLALSFIQKGLITSSWNSPSSNSQYSMLDYRKLS